MNINILFLPAEKTNEEVFGKYRQKEDPGYAKKMNNADI